MAEIHKNAPYKKQRMTTFHAKKKTLGQKIAAGIRGYGPAVVGGLKKVGSELSKPETQAKLASLGSRLGESSRSMFSGGYGSYGGYGGYSKPTPRRKVKKYKAKKTTKKSKSKGRRIVIYT